MTFSERSGGLPGEEHAYKVHPEKEVSARVEELLHPYTEEVTTPEGEKVVANVRWDRAINQFGDVEISTYGGQKKADGAIFVCTGLGGSVDKNKKRLIKEAFDHNYDLVLVHRNGAVIKEKSADSPQRIEKAKADNQEHFGPQPEYGYKDWVTELATAVHGVGDRYQNVKVVGESLGGLIAMEGLRLLNEAHDPNVKKIDTFVSLSGQIGKLETDAEGITWIDKSRKYSLNKSPKSVTAFDKDVIDGTRAGGALRMRPGSEQAKEYADIVERLYAPGSALPTHVNVIQAMPWSELYFATQQGRTMMERFGKHALFIADRTQTGTSPKPDKATLSEVDYKKQMKKIMGERHGMPQLKGKTIMKWLETDPTKYKDRVMVLTDQAADFKPAAHLGR